MRDSKLTEAVLEIFRRAYRESDPPVDFDELMKIGKTQVAGWFNNYYLPTKRLTEIFDEVCKERKIKGYYKDRMRMEVYLGGSPTGVK